MISSKEKDPCLRRGIARGVVGTCAGKLVEENRRACPFRQARA